MGGQRRVHTPWPAHGFPLSDAVSQEASEWLHVDSHPESDTYGAAQRMHTMRPPPLSSAPLQRSVCPSFTGACQPDSESTSTTASISTTKSLRDHQRDHHCTLLCPCSNVQAMRRVISLMVLCRASQPPLVARASVIASTAAQT